MASPLASATLTPTEPSSYRRADGYDVVARRALGATALLGVLVAWASEFPSIARDPLLAGGLVFWFVVTGWTAIRALRRAWITATPSAEWAAGILGSAGIAVTVVSSMQLEIIRTANHRPALSWNVDWRYAWNHAQAIARFGGVDRALDYSGAAVDYHVGPAWLGAAAERVMGTGMTTVLFGVVPAICVITITIALLVLTSRGGSSRRIAAAGIAVAFCLPLGIPMSRFPLTLSEVVSSPDVWIFGPGLNINAYFGLAVGLASVALLVDESSGKWWVALGVVGLSAVAQLKPPQFIGFGALVAVVGIGRAFAVKPFGQRSLTVLIAGLVSLLAGAMAKQFLPGIPIQVAVPDLLPGSTGFTVSMTHPWLMGAMLAMAVGVWAMSPDRSSAQFSHPRGEFAIATVVTHVLIAMTVLLIAFPIRATKAEGVQRSLAHALDPTELLLPVIVVLALVSLLTRRPAWRSWLLALGGLVVLAPVPRIALGFRDPLRGYEAVEDSALRSLLQRIPRDGAVLIASDIADEAEGFARDKRAAILTAYGGHQFYVSNTAYVHFARPDLEERMDNLRSFFGSEWSDWHHAWLWRTGITHVFVNDRCLPVWWDTRDSGLQMVGHDGEWTVLARRVAPTNAVAPRPSSRPVVPRHGGAPCL